jgi:hypothetical protein
MRLGMKAGREIFEAHYLCCRQAGKKDKGKILDEAAGTTGLNRICVYLGIGCNGRNRAGRLCRLESVQAKGSRLNV